MSAAVTGLRPRAACLGLGALAGVLVFVSSMMTVLLTVAIWPGEAKLTAPLFCPDGKPDAFVVVDSQSIPSGGTAYDFSLHCMGPRGEVTEVGFFWPCAVLTLGHGLLVVGLVGIVMRRRLRRWATRVLSGRDDVQLAPDGHS
ncbi:MAG: hypothetical protein ACRD2C_15050 [Acidimicrobiales bacterium]